MHKIKNCPFSTGTDAYLNAAYSKNVFRSNHPGSVAFELRLIGQSPFLLVEIDFSKQLFLPVQRPFLPVQRPFLPVQRPFLPMQTTRFKKPRFFGSHIVFDRHRIQFCPVAFET